MIPAPGTVEDADFVERMIGDITRTLGPRRSASHEEREAQLWIRDIFEQLGLETEMQSFEFNDNLYEVLALHFGLGTIAAALGRRAPGWAAALHLLAGTSYLSDSVRSGYALRRLFPFRPSQNLLATLPAIGEPRLRIVLPAHIDSAPTGWMFDPRVVSKFGGHEKEGPLAFTRHSLALATAGEFLGAGLSFGRRLFGWRSRSLRALEWALAIPGFLAFVLNAQVALRRQYVDGANDNLTGVAALPILARRLLDAKPDDVEIVFAVTGCEESGTGGAWALSRRMRAEWSPKNTVIVGLDTLSNGDLFWFQEAEIIREPIAPWLEALLEKTVASDPRFSGIRRFVIPAGATDALPFLAQGYAGVTIGAVDLEYGAPRHYHHPSDRLENLDVDAAVRSIDFAEAVMLSLFEADLD